jgi:hypothetical protein
MSRVRLTEKFGIFWRYAKAARSMSGFVQHCGSERAHHAHGNVNKPTVPAGKKALVYNADRNWALESCVTARSAMTPIADSEGRRLLELVP